MNDIVHPRILVVDDNVDTLTLVQRALERAGYEVITALGGSAALELMERAGLPHLAIIDIHMPFMNGFDLARQLHSFSDVPIIMLTAESQTRTIIAAIDEFADDYVTKPFNPGELVARVSRVLSRQPDFDYVTEKLTSVDESLQVDFQGRLAIRDEESVSLTPLETKLLYILIQNKGRTVTTDFLLRRLWPADEAYEDRLRVHIHRLRKKIRDDDDAFQYIKSERGIGYRFQGRPA